jgi:hypothetical protein
MAITSRTLAPQNLNLIFDVHSSGRTPPRHGMTVTVTAIQI